MSKNRYEAIEVAIALSLYAYNVAPGLRAERLRRHSNGNSAEPEDLLRIMNRPGYASTELALPTAEVYVQHALMFYGYEARKRVRANREFTL